MSVYIHRTGQVMLKMKSKHVAGTFTKKKKSKPILLLGTPNVTARGGDNFSTTR